MIRGGYLSRIPSPSASHPHRRRAAAQPPLSEHCKPRKERGGGATTPRGPSRAPAWGRSPPPSLPHPRGGLHGTAQRTICTASALHCDTSHQPRHPRYAHVSVFVHHQAERLRHGRRNRTQGVAFLHLSRPSHICTRTRTRSTHPGPGSESRPCGVAASLEPRYRSRPPWARPAAPRSRHEPAWEVPKAPP